METDRLIAQVAGFKSNGPGPLVYGHVSARDGEDIVAIKAGGVPMATASVQDVARVTFDGADMSPGLGDSRRNDHALGGVQLSTGSPSGRPHAPHLLPRGESLRSARGIYSQHQVIFADSLAFCDNALLVNNPESAMNFASCLGSNRAALLRGHGLLTVGDSVEEAVVLAVLLERAMQILVTGRSAGSPTPMRGDEVAALGHLFAASHPTRMRDVWGALAK